jgi:chromosome partitioning protein
VTVLAIAIQRGGTAKTTTAAALTQAAAKDGRRVLAIDLDPQGNLSFSLAGDMNRRSSFELFEGKPAADIQRTPCGAYLIPASWNLSTVTTAKGSAYRLRRAIEPLKSRFELIIIDTPPTAGELQYNALQAATGLIIPLQADLFSLQGLYQIADTAAKFRNTNPALNITGIVLTKHNTRSTISKQMQQTIVYAAAEMGIPYLGAIREGVAIREAQTLQLSLFDYAPNSKPAADYMNLYHTITGGADNGK